MDPEAGLELTQSFIVVAEELNFRRSAERLRVDQSALSRRIQKLEHILGFALFDGRPASVADTGRPVLYEECPAAAELRPLCATARLIAEGKTGSLRLAYMLGSHRIDAPRGVRYRRLHPHVDVTCAISVRKDRSWRWRMTRSMSYMIGPFDHSDYSLLLTSDPLYVVARTTMSCCANARSSRRTLPTATSFSATGSNGKRIAGVSTTCFPPRAYHSA